MSTIIVSTKKHKHINKGYIHWINKSMRISSENEGVFTPLEWQARVLMELELKNPEVLVALTSRQIGKTTMIKSIIYKMLLEKAETKIIYLADTITQSNNLMFKTLVDSNPPLFPKAIIKHVNRQHRILTLRNGSVLYCGGREGLEPFRGYAVDAVLNDEMQSIENENELLEVISPMVAAKSGKLMFFGTCKDEFNFAYRMYKKAQQNPDWSAFRVPIDHPWCKGAPTSTEKNINFQKKILDKASFEAEWLTIPQTLDGLVYKEFTLKNIKRMKVNDDLPLHIGVDFNHSNMSAVICQKYENTLYVVDEICQTYQGSNTNSLCKAIIEKYGTSKTRKAGIIVWPDASGRNRDASRADIDATNIKIIRGHGLVCKFDHGGNPPIVDSTVIVNGLICNTDGDRNFFIDPSCKNSVESMTRLKWNKQESGHDKSGKVDHCSDAIRYVIWGLFKDRNKLVTGNFF